jgi:hypothetical protein
MAWVASGVACGSGAAPEFEDIPDQIAQVGVELNLELRATDADGDQITFLFTSEVPDIDASITLSPSGTGIFRWTPLSRDVGQWYFDFTASDGSSTTTVTVPIDVRSAVGAETAPLFRQPLGTGTTLDLTTDDCIDLSIVIEDQDSASVEIGHEEPVIEGSTVEQLDGLTGAWHWCPTQAQAEAEDRYTLVLSADDQNNPKTLKEYLIVLRGNVRPDCPGAAPVVSHSSSNQSTLMDVEVSVGITDDKSLKQPPLFYYSTSPVGSAPDLGAMTQLSMRLASGNMSNGTWTALIPNPVAELGAGASSSVYYVILADDDDDEVGNCDHSTQSPASGAYMMTVSNPGGSGSGQSCDGCSADIQCGSAGALCVRLGAEQDAYCLSSCDGGNSCPSGFSCSSNNVTSVSGASGRQCVPDVGSCAGGGVCVDDAYENNDSRSQAASNQPLPAGQYDLVSCPASDTSDDEDWYGITISEDSRVDINLSGEAQTDLDLGLYDSSGTRLSVSTSLSSQEMITRCLVPGTYFIRVQSLGQAANHYSLGWDRSVESCASVCVDDDSEDDDTRSQARQPSESPYSSTGQQICANDDDFFELFLFAGDRLTADLTFNQADSTQDLDFHLLTASGLDLMPCSPQDSSSCQFDNGQSADSDEHLEYVAPTECTGGCLFYLVVRGYGGASNSYSIGISWP